MLNSWAIWRAKKIYSMGRFSTNKIQNGKFTLVTFETALNSRMKLDKGGMHVGRRGHLKVIYEPDPFK